MNDEVLRQGSNGDDVSELQTHLHQLTFYAGTIDGYFGPTTEEAVIAYREWSGAGYGTEVDQELRTALTGHAEQAETPVAVDVTDLQTHLHHTEVYENANVKLQCTVQYNGPEVWATFDLAIDGMRSGSARKRLSTSSRSSTSRPSTHRRTGRRSASRRFR